MINIWKKILTVGCAILLFLITPMNMMAAESYGSMVASTTVGITNKRFSDVDNPSHPYFNAIYWAADEGITKGYADGTFGIDRSCTRGEMIMFLWRAAGKHNPNMVSKSPFKDVANTHTFYKAVLWGHQNGITKGYSDGTFGINRNVSRGECMMFLWRLVGSPTPGVSEKTPFKDVPASHVFYKAILWGAQNGITTGYTTGSKKGTFGIKDNCTRGQIVTFIYRVKNGLGKLNSEEEIDLQNTLDNDKDGVPDSVELLFGSDPNSDDTDEDGLSDSAELFIVDTNPTLKDTDGDGVFDGDEDADNDGLTNIEEIEYATNPLLVDSDHDGLSDYDEIYVYCTDPTEYDTDGDGISDGDELTIGTNPLSSCTDGIINDGEKCFQQELTGKSIDETLISDNVMCPSIFGNVPDIIDNHVFLSEYNGFVLNDNRALVGKAVHVSSSYTDDTELTISFTADPLVVDRLDYYVIATIIDGEIEICETTVEGNQLIANISEGDYFVLDAEKLLEEINIPISKYRNIENVTYTEEFSTKIDYVGNNDVDDKWYNENYVVINKEGDVVDLSEDETPFDSETISSEIDITLSDNDDQVSQITEEPGFINNDNDGETTAPQIDITDIALDDGEQIVLASTLDQSMDDLSEELVGSISGQADIVFVIDTTGSMSDAINNVAYNIDSFVDALQSVYSVRANFALIDYKDITCNEDTILVMNGSSPWFNDVTDFKNKINSLYVTGGGDNPETPIDALAVAQKLDFRQNANKFVILVTDADYKTDNNYGIASMSEMTQLLAESGIVTSVISSTYYESDYHDLYTKTNGVFGNIYDNFNSVLVQLANSIGEIVNDGSWVLLNDFQFIKLDRPLENNNYSSDADTLSDWEELGSLKEKDVKPFIEWVMKAYNIPSDMYDDPTTVSVYDYRSNPILPDTDFDGIDDDDDYYRKNNTFTGQVMSYKKDSKDPSYGVSAGKIKFTMDYRKFFGNLKEFDETLSTMSWIYASDIYEDNPRVKDDSDTEVFVDGLLTKDHNTVELMEKFGLHNATKIEVGYSDNDRTDIVIGHRLVNNNNANKEVIVVSIRGTNSTFAEWSSNFDVGADTSEYAGLIGQTTEWKTRENHKGFDVTANRVVSAISNYISTTKEINNSVPKIFLLTGHSRGAAVANVVAAYLIDKGNAVVAYTFATPETTTASSAKDNKYRSIFNVINADDLIPRLPLEDKWHFKRYGIDKTGSIAGASGGKTWFGLGGEYKEGPFNDFVGIKYDNNEKVNSMIDTFSKVCDSRSGIYHFTYEDDTLELQGLNHFSKESAQKDLDSFKNSKPAAMQIMADFRIIEGKNGFGKTVWRDGCYQTPGYFMQGLADLAATSKVHEMAGKFTKARNDFVIVYLSGMVHPHMVQSYYLLSNGTVRLAN